MRFTKFMAAALAAAMSLSMLTSCSEQPGAELLAFNEVEEVKNVEIPADGKQKYLAYEIEFVSDKEYENPVYTVDMDVIFTNKTSGTELKVPAFWDGGTNWKVRYALTELGTWTWQTVCTDEANTGLHGLSGEVECVEYVGDLDIYKHGFLKAEDGTRYLMYRDGTPFFYLGDTHWTLPMLSLDSYNHAANSTYSKITEEKAENLGITSQFEFIMDYRAEQGFTVIQSQQLGSNGGAVDYGAGLTNYGCPDSWMGYDGKTILETGIDEKIVAQFNQLDKYFEYIAEKGFVHAHAQLGTYPSPFINQYFAGVVTDEQIDKLSRYWAARYCAYPVIWTTAQEADNDYYAERGDCVCPSPEQNPWRIVMESVAKYDPYDHPSTAHSEGAGYTRVAESSFDELESHSLYAPQWSPDMDANPTKDPGQQEILDWDMLMEYWNNPYERPVINYEGGYDHHWSSPLRVRMLGWCSFLNGQFGFGYGAQPIWALHWANGDATSAPIYSDDYVKYRRDQTWLEGLFLDGGDQMIYMKELLTKYEWWKLVPCFEGNEYFSPRKTEVHGYYSGSCMATVENELYIGYFYGQQKYPYDWGTLTGMANGTYEVQWLNCESGLYFHPETVTITDGTYDVCKPTTADCVLVARLIQE